MTRLQETAHQGVQKYSDVGGTQGDEATSKVWGFLVRSEA